nr:HAD family hydrolase [Roseospirillum parvum]
MDCHKLKAMLSPSRPFVLIDRDGTLNVEVNYLSRPDDLALIPGAGPALARLQAAGYGVVVVTNQSGLARGYFTPADLEAVHARLGELLAAHGVRLDAIEVCPHGPDDDCDCRKPRPGMVLRAAARLGFDPGAAIVIGDKPADIGLGRAVGARTILVRTGYGAETEAAGIAHPDAPDAIVDDLPAAIELILAGGPTPEPRR